MSQDLMETLLTKDGFWKSKHVRNEVSKLQGYKNYPETEEAIWILKKEVIRLNSRNCYIGPQGRDIILMDEIKISDGKANYIFFRKALFLFIDLLLIFDKEMVKKHGRNYLDEVRNCFSGDPRPTAFHALLEANIGSRLSLTDAIEKVGRKGISFKTTGGIGGGYKGRDCGIEPLVELTNAIENNLRILAAKDQENRKIEIGKCDPNSMPKAIVKFPDPETVKVIYNKSSIQLIGKEATFLRQLFFNKADLSYRDLWEKVYGNEAYLSADAGPPCKLKTLKKTVQKKLKKSLGTVSLGAGWIATVRKFGYKLNREVVVWSNEKDFKLSGRKEITNWDNRNTHRDPKDGEDSD